MVHVVTGCAMRRSGNSSVGLAFREGLAWRRASRDMVDDWSVVGSWGIVGKRPGGG